MKVLNEKPVRTFHFTPLRYPGGKGKLAAFIKRIMKTNDLMDGDYVEPYAGGAAIALELLFHEYVDRIHINDISRPVYSFWSSVLNDTDELCRLIYDTPRSVDAWDVQKKILANEREHCELSVGFAMFYLNRTNRSGILNGGIIGGRSQSGQWKIDARYNAEELIARIEKISNMKNRICITRCDALEFLRAGVETWKQKTLIYCDPPYYVKGRELYYHFYKHDDHIKIAEFMQSESVKQSWVVSYDAATEVHELYRRSRHITYSIGYSARSSKKGCEAMFFDSKLKIPDLVGPINLQTYNPADLFVTPSPSAAASSAPPAS